MGQSKVRSEVPRAEGPCGYVLQASSKLLLHSTLEVWCSLLLLHILASTVFCLTVDQGLSSAASAEPRFWNETPE